MEATQKKSALSVNMTEGSLWKNMLLFSLPLMLTQVLEVLFNLSDVAIAGKFADYRALGAVGSTTLLVSLFTGLLIGMGSGVNVAVARGLGMGDKQRVEKTVHTSFVLCAAIGVVLCLICVLPAMAVYNCGNGIMSAVGDTRRPLLYLSVAGVLNVVLNLFFVIRCHMAAEGVAIASVIAQCLSALLIVLHLLRRKDACRLELRRLRVHPQEARRVLAIGIPAGLQNAIFAVANLFVQVGLNSFDAVTVSGSSAAANADTLLFNMMAAFYTGCASFVSRNWGAGKTERIVKSYLVSMCYAAGVGAVCGLLLLFFGRSFLGLFANETAVIDAGMQRLRIMSFSYVVSPLMDASIAASRGIGKSVGPTVIVILGSCVFRVIWVYTVFAWLGTITSLYLLYIFSWTITGAAEIVYFRRSYKKVILSAQSW